jgi:hypothetical protein
VVSNQTSQPLALYGQRFEEGMRLRLGPPFDRELSTTVLDVNHAFARLPADLDIPPARSQQTITLSLIGSSTPSTGPGISTVTAMIVNDSHFPDLIALTLSHDGKMAFAASLTTDVVYAIDWRESQVSNIAVGDGPSALSTWVDPNGREWLVVVHEFVGKLLLISADGKKEQKALPAPAYATGLVVDQSAHTAYVAEHATDSVVALKLSEGARVLWQTPVQPNPRALAVAGKFLAVGSLQTGEVQLLDRATGRSVRQIAPTPNTSIIGGKTEPYAKYIMGGKAVRALVFSERLGQLFVSSIGPNIGPNPDRWEVSPNSGVGVIDPNTGKFTKHLGFGAGVTEGMALDDGASILYAADIATGVVRMVDARQILHDGVSASRVLLGEISVPPPEAFPTVRPAEDYGVSGRAGIELYSGPKAVALTPDRSTLLVLNRFTGTLGIYDVRRVPQKPAIAKSQISVVDTLTQRSRRMGQILYFSDVGKTGMSCDACHLEGHTEGVFFAKTHPMRIYRAATVRGSRETPPYFTPASTQSIRETAKEVGNRNRFHNPDLTEDEINRLALYTEDITTLPNPFVGVDGSPMENLKLPDGHVGHPRRGMKLFEGVAECVQCHPPPLFTTDQDPATRGRYLDVGTPTALPIRLEMQELKSGFAPPSLLGAWDIFPMLGSGAAGFEAGADGTLAVATRFPLRTVVEVYGRPPHGNAAALNDQQRDDLLAYLLSL